jgi:uncharacterized protein YodC (DUF2158 family)
MTNAVSVSNEKPDFNRGHRVRFANGPVMTVMGYDKDDHGDILVLCGWWRSDQQLEIEVFHPNVLIHTDENYGMSQVEAQAEDTDGYTTFHAG